jgi:hypothetical protein
MGVKRSGALYREKQDLRDISGARLNGIMAVEKGKENLLCGTGERAKTGLMEGILFAISPGSKEYLREVYL